MRPILDENAVAGIPVAGPAGPNRRCLRTAYGKPGRKRWPQVLPASQGGDCRARPAIDKPPGDGGLLPGALGVVRTRLTGQDGETAITYSVYEARARFSEVIRLVRSGSTVTVSYRGEPVAETRSIQRDQSPTLEERLADLERRGALVRSTLSGRTPESVERRPGALARFLAER